MQQRFQAVVDSSAFQRFIMATILFAGVLVGIETYPGAVAEHGTLLHALDRLILAIFVIEIVVKMAAHGSRPWRYFRDGWNVFDFLIVAACFLPVDAHYVTVLRLARLLRVLKLVRALPRLQILVGAILRSIPSMGFVALLLFLVFYIYAVAGTFLFGANDPIHFGTLPTSMLSLFRAVTLEDWTDLMYIQMEGCAAYGYDGNEGLCTASNANPILGAVYFVSFILIGTMIMLNLFIGVIMNGMSQAQAEREADERDRQRQGGEPTLADELHTLNLQLQAMQQQIEQVGRRAAKLQARAEGNADSPLRAAG
jgi:voltage-gated sodium channel